MNISQSNEFKKDLKHLSKKYRTLEKDLEILIRAICVEPKGDGTKHWNLLTRVGEVYILKVRMMCRSVRGSDFRVVYMYDDDKIELIFIEMYFKGNKENEDRNRIEEYIKSKNL